MTELEKSIAQAVRGAKRIHQAMMQNTILRNNLANSSLSDEDWRAIEHLTQHSDEQELQILDVYELYGGVRALLAMARTLNSEVKPNLRSELARPRGQISPENRVVLEMTVTNLDHNVGQLLDCAGELYVATGKLDEEQNGAERMARADFPELSDPKTWEVSGVTQQ